ncbi:MAG: SpoIIIAH-like family protein [Ruminococcaceae bacterium]|nr:SpoIIIAH-like family protein [Oscillospiraceae bacterium]
MSVKVKRIIALGVCVCLLGVAVVQNVRSNKKSESEPKPTAVANAKPLDTENSADEFFAQARLERESVRAEAEALCAAVIADSESTAEEISQANAKVEALRVIAETESNLESLIAGRGYQQVLVELTDDGQLEITVSEAEIDEAEATAIATAAYESTGISIDNLCVKCFNG